MTSKIRSLHELCFENIWKNISRHTTAYKNTKDQTLRRNLSFLQRFHTQNLISKLIRNGELAEEHFDFLLNEFLKELMISPFLKCSTKETIVTKVLPIAHNLNELYCDRENLLEDKKDWENRLDKDSLYYILRKLLPHSTNVTKVHIPCICTDELLKLIASSCSHLIQLSIQKSAITSIGIKALCCNLNWQKHVSCSLKYLDLMDSSLTIEDVAFVLQKLPDLEEVIFADLPRVIEFIDSKRENKTLKHNLRSLSVIRFPGCYDSLAVTKLLQICCRKCPKIKLLTVVISNARDLYFTSCFKELETVYFYSHFVSLNLNIFLIRNGEHIKLLSVDSFSLSITKLIENCPILEDLYLNSVKCQKLDGYPESMLSKLETLTLFDLNFRNLNCRDSILYLLSSCPKLESFTLQYCKFGKSEVSNLPKYPQGCNLSHAQLKNTAVGAELLHQFILNSHSIKTLQLFHCENIRFDDVVVLQQIVKASNRDIEIDFNEELNQDSVSGEDDDSESDPNDDEYDSDAEFDIDFENDHSPYIYWSRDCGILRTQLR